MMVAKVMAKRTLTTTLNQVNPLIKTPSLLGLACMIWKTSDFVVLIVDNNKSLSSVMMHAGDCMSRGEGGLTNRFQHKHLPNSVLLPPLSA